MLKQERLTLSQAIWLRRHSQRITTQLDATDNVVDKKMIQRIQQVTKMEAKDREHVFAMLDAFIKQNLSQTVLQ